MAYKPLYIFMSPASIPQIVAHIQDYLVKNPIVTTETVAEIVVKALSEYPELINGSVIPITEDSQQTIKEYIDNLPTIDAYTKAQVDALLTGKQNTLEFDQTPTADSTNPVTSGGVASALVSLNSALTALINSKADLSAVYTKASVDLLLSEKADADDVYSKNTIDAKLLQYPTTENVYTKADIDLMKQVNKANIAITSTDGTAPIEILAGQYVYLADVLYMATETIPAGSQLIPEGNITINPRGVTNRIGDGLKNAVNQINGFDDRLSQAEQDISSQSQQIANVQKGLAYIVGDTNTTGSTLAIGAFVYVKGHSTIAEGLRKVTATDGISANGSITINNTEDCTVGGLNALSSNLAKKPTIIYSGIAWVSIHTITLPSENGIFVVIGADGDIVTGLAYSDGGGGRIGQMGTLSRIASVTVSNHTLTVTLNNDSSIVVLWLN